MGAAGRDFHNFNVWVSKVLRVRYEVSDGGELTPVILGTLRRLGLAGASWPAP